MSVATSPEKLGKLTKSQTIDVFVISRWTRFVSERKEKHDDRENVSTYGTVLDVFLGFCNEW